VGNEAVITEAYARLESLRDNLPDFSVGEKYVREFHEILQLLEKDSGADLTRFRVPAGEVKPRVTSANYLRGTCTYSKTGYCDRSFLKMKVDAVIRFFELQSSNSKPAIGFALPQRG